MQSIDADLITDKQRNLIECMNEFCREKFDLGNCPTKQMAQAYISRNIDEYKLQSASNWHIENGYF